MLDPSSTWAQKWEVVELGNHLTGEAILLLKVNLASQYSAGRNQLLRILQNGNALSREAVHQTTKQICQVLILHKKKSRKIDDFVSVDTALTFKYFI